MFPVSLCRSPVCDICARASGLSVPVCNIWTRNLCNYGDFFGLGLRVSCDWSYPSKLYWYDLVCVGFVWLYNVAHHHVLMQINIFWCLKKPNGWIPHIQRFLDFAATFGNMVGYKWARWPQKVMRRSEIWNPFEFRHAHADIWLSRLRSVTNRATS